MPEAPTLYHGTDARMLKMSAEERSQHTDDCIRIIDSLWPFYEPYVFMGEKHCDLLPLLGNDERAYNEVTNVLRHIRGYKDGDSQWQYQKNSLYLTAFENNAESFARNGFAGGEIGFLSFTLLKYLPRMHFDEYKPDSQTQESIRRISDFATSTPDPIVLKFEGLDPNDMIDDKEQKVEPHENPIISQTIFRAVRYLKPIKLDLDSATHLLRD